MKYCSAVDLTKDLTPNKEFRYQIRAGLKDGLTVSEVPFAEFKRFYTSIVTVIKPESVWDTLAASHFAFMAHKDGVPISAAAFTTYEDQVYYSMAVTDFSSPYSAHSGYVLQYGVMQALKEIKGYRFYVVGVLAQDTDSPKLKAISDFKERLGSLYVVEGEKFPFDSYTPVVGDGR